MPALTVVTSGGGFQRLGLLQTHVRCVAIQLVLKIICISPHRGGDVIAS
jgi:hypothetical protein